jgi:uncharacterized metal-binding protein YceD (DUF177 family)
MPLRLEEITPGKTLEREVTINREIIEMVTGEVTFKDIHANLAIRSDPLGYVVHCRATGEVEMACIRCGAPMEQEIATDDWISLRTQQPDQTHIVLDKAEMNIRFLDEQVLDLDRFVLETVELELPDYPRHEDGDQTCQSTLDNAPQEEKISPFDVLSKYLS